MPVIKKFQIDGREVTYMNSGDWVENLSALEFDGKQWNLEYFTERVNGRQMRDGIGKPKPNGNGRVHDFVFPEADQEIDAEALLSALRSGQSG
jgi:hypothetical protein